MTTTVVSQDSQILAPSSAGPSNEMSAGSTLLIRGAAKPRSDRAAVLDKIRVLIADDCPEEMGVLQRAVRSASYIAVVGGAFNGQDAFTKAARTQPDVILMDARMPEMDGLEAIRRIKEDLPGIKILFLGEHPTDVAPALSSGADGYIVKHCGRQELLAGIRGLVRQRASEKI